MPVETMGVDVEEVFLRTMFGVAQVNRETLTSGVFGPHKGLGRAGEKTMVHTWLYGAGDMGKCGLVSQAWAKEFKAWLASEEKRVTEVMWEQAARDGVELCCSMNKPLTQVGYLLVFEKREVVDVLFRRIGPFVEQYLGTVMNKWPTQATGAKMMTVPGVVWNSERKWVVPPVEMDEALAQERDVVEGWETATVAELVEWLRATFPGL
jgi:hypothetical protein